MNPWVAMVRTQPDLGARVAWMGWAKVQLRQSSWRQSTLRQPIGLGASRVFDGVIAGLQVPLHWRKFVRKNHVNQGVMMRK